jgi:hypothetical protein
VQDLASAKAHAVNGNWGRKGQPMMYRRQFLCFATLLLTARATLMPAGVALAQQKPDKPELKRSEVWKAAERYVSDVSKHAKESMGVELSDEQKQNMIDNIISGIYAQGTYAVVDP